MVYRGEHEGRRVDRASLDTARADFARGGSRAAHSSAALARWASCLAASALLACGGAEPSAPAQGEPTASGAEETARQDPAAPQPGPLPPAARLHTIALSALVPEPAPSVGRLAPDGSFSCTQTWWASPPETWRPEQRSICAADGHGVRADVLHTWDDAGHESRALISPIVVRRVRDCGNDETEVRRPPRALITAIAPDLAAMSRGADTAHDDVVAVSCARPDLIVEVPEGVQYGHEGSALRFRATEGIHLIRVMHGERELHRFALGQGAVEDECGGSPITVRYDLDLEVVCAGDFVVVSGATFRAPIPSRCEEVRPRQATGRGPGAPCAPAAERGDGYVLQEAARVRVDLRDGSAVQLASQPLRFAPTATP